MISDFLGSIGGIEFVSAEQAFTEAVDAQRSGTFGRPEEELIQTHFPPPNDSPAADATVPTVPAPPD
jgi:hypothetical protein